MISGGGERQHNELISIIVPIYNVSQWLERCLDSIKNQSLKNYEVLMIDDGSTDDSYFLAEKYCDDSRFKLYKQANAGQGAARNLGLKYANGDYIVFVDSDDWIHEDYLKTMYQTIMENDADIVVCGAERVWSTGVHRTNQISNRESYVVSDKGTFLKRVSYVVWDKMYRRKLLDGLSFPAHMKYEDYVFTPQAVAKAQKIVCISDVLYYYFWRSDSTVNEIQYNRDILKAQRILENTSFSHEYRAVLTSYFVRNIMGTLLWKMLYDLKNRKEIKEIMEKGKEEYPDLKNYIVKGNIGSVLIGKLLYNENYFLAFAITRITFDVKNTLKPLYHRILKAIQKQRKCRAYLENKQM